MTASSQMETAPMNGKSWQPNHEPPHRKEKAGTCHIDKTVERGGGAGEGKQPLSRVPLLETWMLEESSDSVKLHETLVVQEHMESWHMHRSECQ